MNTRSRVVAASLLLLAGCAGTPRRHTPLDAPWHPPTAMLLPYVGPDGSLTRAQMETGLRRDFAKVDVHHNGCLDDSEVRIINEQRWKQDASTASPLIDFKHNGCVDFDEFAATPRSLFDQLDAKGVGKLTAAQLKPGGAKPDQPATEGSSQHHRGQAPGG